MHTAGLWQDQTLDDYLHLPLPLRPKLMLDGHPANQLGVSQFHAEVTILDLKCVNLGITAVRQLLCVLRQMRGHYQVHQLFLARQPHQGGKSLFGDPRHAHITL